MHIQAHKFAHKSRLGLVMALAIFAGMTTVHASAQDNTGPDPADVNMAPVDGSQQPAAAAQQSRTRASSEPTDTSQNRSPGRRADRPGSTQNAVLRNTPDQQYDPERGRRRRRSGRARRRRLRPAPASPRLRPARGPRAQLSLDPRLLELRPRRLLLGPRSLVCPSLLRRALDPRLLVLLRQPLPLPSRLLGPSHRLLRRH